MLIKLKEIDLSMILICSGVIREWPNLLKLLQILQRLPSLRILILTINLEFPMDPDTDEAEQEYQRNKTEIGKYLITLSLCYIKIDNIAELEAQKTWSKLECLKVLTVGPWQCHHKTVESNFPPGIVSLSYGLYQYEDEVPIQELRPLEAFIRGQFRSYDNDKRCADILNQQNFTGGLDLIRIKRIHFSNLRTLTITIIVRGQVTKELWSISKDCPNLESLSVLLMAPFLDGGPGIQTTFWRSQRLSCHPEGLTPLIMFPELKTFTVLIFVKKDEDSVPFVVELLRNFNCFRNGKWFQAKKPKLLKLESDPPPDKSPAGFIMEQETRVEQLDSYNLIQDEAKPLDQENWFTKDLDWKKLDRKGLSYKLTRYRTKH